MALSGPRSIERIGRGCVYTTPIEAMPVRLASRTTLVIWLVLYAPKKRVPSLEGSAHPTQNASPVGAMVGVNHASGITGLGPSWLVFAGGGGGVAHVSCGPHPKFAPLAIRLISSLHSGPFSVCQNLAVSG